VINDKSKTLPKVKDNGPTMDRVDPLKVAQALGAKPSEPPSLQGQWPVVIHHRRRKKPQE
jgi:hypothetical protein